MTINVQFSRVVISKRGTTNNSYIIKINAKEVYVHEQKNFMLGIVRKYDRWSCRTRRSIDKNARAVQGKFIAPNANKLGNSNIGKRISHDMSLAPPSHGTRNLSIMVKRTRSHPGWLALLQQQKLGTKQD